MGDDDDINTTASPSKQSDDSDAALESAPAKTALFGLTAMFQFISNQPLLRLIVTALFHPLSPEPKGGRMIRTKPDVAFMRADGKVHVRVEPKVILGTNLGDMFDLQKHEAYNFGRLTGDELEEGTPHAEVESSDELPKLGDETCVFLLSPALAEILVGEHSGTRPNPYREVILSALAGTNGMTALHSLAVMAISAIVSPIEGGFASDVLFGVGVAMDDDIPDVDGDTPVESHTKSKGKKKRFRTKMFKKGDTAKNISEEKSEEKSDTNPETEPSFMDEVVGVLISSVISASMTSAGTNMKTECPLIPGFICP
jgi:hypothetical protein